MAKWENCFDTQEHYPRIKANLQEGVRRGVSQTRASSSGTR